MSERDEHLRRGVAEVVARLEVQLAKVEADVAVLKALLAEDGGEGPG
jgi:hypothetical protein